MDDMGWIMKKGALTLIFNQNVSRAFELQINVFERVLHFYVLKFSLDLLLLVRKFYLVYIMSNQKFWLWFFFIIDEHRAKKNVTKGPLKASLQKIKKLAQ